MSGRFIAFEGLDASGKTTHARRIAGLLDAVFIREPGSTPVGESLRDLLLDTERHVVPRAEALLMAASRAQLTSEVIAPTLRRGIDVVTDRFLASSIVYQGYGSGLDVDDVRALSMFATDGLLPDLTVLIDVPVSMSMSRLDAHRDRFEAEGVDYHERVRAGYLELAAADPATWVVVDGAGSLEEVGDRVDAALVERLGEPAPRLL